MFYQMSGFNYFSRYPEYVFLNFLFRHTMMLKFICNQLLPEWPTGKERMEKGNIKY